jgi:flagellar biosynthesis protein
MAVNYSDPTRKFARPVLKAVALKYEMNSAAPRVTGQGEGYVAQAILDKAKEMGIPTKVEPELVEFLMQVKLNDIVPPKLFAAVAEVLAWAYDVDGKTIYPDAPTEIVMKAP